LQTSWKQVGHVPKEKVEECWAKFKGHCDRVFAALADWFAKMDIERQEALKLKLVILDKIEGFTKEADPTAFREEVKALQAEWRDIGYIPRESMNEVMGRYQDLCNIIFNVKIEAPAVEQEESKEAPDAVEQDDSNEEGSPVEQNISEDSEEAVTADAQVVLGSSDAGEQQDHQGAEEDEEGKTQ
jgi:hypothetical protein